ncbi:hypothetical protein CPB84DRAFT_1746155 [Gymnopilus junonius]|uniref:AB hydrolase-1 domain-containing protein n=1 Tax=Gymnopilus junonius TaxID=109634 RepID=A0A9P5TNU4_GYMJU|nr:hypothetical protein CPB84DRAFT_1746155 [Gymnopilus junonius]
MSPEPATQYHHGRFRVAGPMEILLTRVLSFQCASVVDWMVLSTKKYFVVTFALFSNGESSSPSNTPAPYNGPYFPAVLYKDNMYKMGIRKVFSAVGFSMGAQQAYYWPVVYPNYVERLIFLLDSFLEGPKAALVASEDFEGGHYKSETQRGIRAFGRAFNAWANAGGRANEADDKFIAKFFEE